MWAADSVDPVDLVRRARAAGRGVLGFVVVLGGTMAMLEPVLPLFFKRGWLLARPRSDGCSAVPAVASAVMPFVCGPMTDRWGGRRLTPIGLLVTAAWMPMMATATSFGTALRLMIVLWSLLSLVVTPSLAYMADVTASAGGDSYGLGYGLYNTAWAVGFLAVPRSEAGCSNGWALVPCSSAGRGRRRRHAAADESKISIPA